MKMFPALSLVFFALLSQTVGAADDSDVQTYSKLRDSCFSSRKAVLAGKDLPNIKDLAPACWEAAFDGCAIYYKQNKTHIKAVDSINAANMCALVSGYKTIESFGFAEQYASMCVDSYKRASSAGVAEDWNNNFCFPDDLLSILDPVSKAKIPAKWQGDYEALSIITQAKRLDFVQEFIDNGETLP